MKLLILVFSLIANVAFAMDHKMQHGFVLSRNDTIASHLVAEGHHSYQSTVLGHLQFAFARDKNAYEELKKNSSNKYYLFQAQDVQIDNLPNVLHGYIVEMEVGQYNTKGNRVENATFVIDEVLSSIQNPFFGFSEH